MKFLHAAPKRTLNWFWTCHLSQKKVSQRTGAYFETVKDLCDQVWQNILEQAIGYDRVVVVPDDYSNEHPIKAIKWLNRGALGTKVSFDLMSKTCLYKNETADT